MQLCLITMGDVITFLVNTFWIKANEMILKT